MAKFLLVDDHEIILEFLKGIITSMGHEVISVAKTGVEAIKEINRLNPQFIILDIGIPNLDGFEVIKRCPPSEDRTYIIFSSIQQELLKDIFHKINMVKYISKQEDISNIKLKLESYIYGDHSKLTELQETSHLDDLVTNLSSRELLVLKYLSQGYRNKEIAKMLIISEKTVSTYKKRLMDKLGCSSMSSLILFVHRSNIL
ncbi:MAG: response regulator transcription factor [Vibrio ordalii]|uniref:response regulator transcription factor n=1 Tax=Vibrio ordalii TaxID=28174 RepID=UPI003F336E59